MKPFLKTGLGALTFVIAGTCAHAAPIDWNTWTSATTGTIPTGPITVTFSAGGSLDELAAGYPSYTPTATFADGSIVDNAPTSANGIVRLQGGNANVNTISFSSAVVNPVMAIWSLGQGGLTASFDFINSTPLFVSGGSNAEYGGLPITVAGNVVSGVEGNGTVMFMGTYTSISWTNPVYEYWYGFNVGIAGVAEVNPTGAVPEPETYAMMLAGLGLLGFAARRRKQQTA